MKNKIQLDATFYQLWSLDKKLQKISHLIHTTNTKTYTNATSYIFTEPDGLCCNQRYRRELLMMGILVPETRWAWLKHNKVISGI